MYEITSEREPSRNPDMTYQAIFRFRLLFLGILSGSIYIAMISLNVSMTTMDERQQPVINDKNGASFHQSHPSKTNDVITPEVQHIVFLKVHKAASSTLMNVFMRFGMSRDLNIMLPKEHNVFSQVYTLKSPMILHYTTNDLYDILCCHVIYNKAAIAPYFPQDTRYIGVVRHPFTQFVSAFLYYRNVHRLHYLVQIPGENPVSTYLKNPRKYEPEHPLMSYTNNRMSFDFGYPYEQFKNTSHMYLYVNQLKSELDFVIVVEYFDESLVMLKRLLGWTLKDILYIPRNNGRRYESFIPKQTHMDRHAQWAELDYILYETFLDIFLTKLENEDDSFFAELNVFKSLRYRVEEYCVGSREFEFNVEATRWNRAFTVTRQDCDIMLLESVKLIQLVKRRYVTKL